MKKFKPKDFNTYDMLVFRLPDTSIEQDCVTCVSKQEIRCSSHAYDFKTKKWYSFRYEDILPGYRFLEIDLIEIWTRTDEDTYKRVWKNENS